MLEFYKKIKNGKTQQVCGLALFKRAGCWDWTGLKALPGPGNSGADTCSGDQCDAIQPGTGAPAQQPRRTPCGGSPVGRSRSSSRTWPGSLTG